MSAERARLRGLYAITPEDADTARLVAAVGACIAGGAALLQYRAKSLKPALQREQADALLGMCRAAGIPFIVNDSVEIARAIGADGVHLGRDDGDVASAREVLGGRRLVGVSCYDEIERVKAAAESHADYVAIGSVFASDTKPGARRASLAMLSQARRECALPVVAIGGVTRANAADAIRAGADMVAVISAVFTARDVEGASREISRLFDAGVARDRDVRAQPSAF
jgi:thiamine-phosphate pyrophosphorylase